MNIGFQWSVIYNWDTVISKVTSFGLDSPECEPQWGQDFQNHHDQPQGPIQSAISSPGGKAAGAWH